jgi:hypothetical protein
MYLPLTQEHIGDATGLTGVHVNRVLGDLKTDGILTFSYRHLSILDPDKLVDVAGVDPELLQSWIGQQTPEQHARAEAYGGISPFSLTRAQRANAEQAHSAPWSGTRGSLPGVNMSPTFTY